MVKRSLLRPFVLLHRYFGVAFCLLFAMWFASGIVMHFVSFPALTESERIAASLPIDLMRISYTPAQVIDASAISEAVRVRLIERADGPVYIVSSFDKTKALRASDLGTAAIRSAEAAIVLAAREHQSHLANMSPPVAVPIWVDQWTVSQQYDPHRPLYKVPLNDPADTDRYVSGTTGEIVLTTTREQRWWNYLGSVSHWIYAVPLRKHLRAWTDVLWLLAFSASVGVALGAVIGISRIDLSDLRRASPYRGLQAWHHWFGLICLPFVLTWIVSGWFSLDNGQLFSTGKLSATQVRAIIGQPDWQSLPPDELRGVSAAAREIEWFAFNSRIYRRELVSPDDQILVSPVDASVTTVRRAFLRPDEIDSALRNLHEPCDPSFAIDDGDKYAAISTMPHAPVFRAICAANWFHVDGSNGVIIEKLDGSRRAYRWLFAGLHRLNFPFLAAHSVLRTVLIVFLCGCGFVFSVTGIVLAQRRVRSLW